MVAQIVAQLVQAGPRPMPRRSGSTSGDVAIRAPGQSPSTFQIDLRQLGKLVRRQARRRTIAAIHSERVCKGIPQESPKASPSASRAGLPSAERSRMGAPGATDSAGATRWTAAQDRRFTVRTRLDVQLSKSPSGPAALKREPRRARSGDPCRRSCGRLGKSTVLCAGAESISSGSSPSGSASTIMRAMSASFSKKLGFSHMSVAVYIVNGLVDVDANSGTKARRTARLRPGPPQFGTPWSLRGLLVIVRTRSGVL